MPVTISLTFGSFGDIVLVVQLAIMIAVYTRKVLIRRSMNHQLIVDADVENQGSTDLPLTLPTVEQIREPESTLEKLIKYRDIYDRLLTSPADVTGKVPKRYATRAKSSDAQAPKQQTIGRKAIMELLRNEDLAELRLKQISAYLQSLMTSR